MPNWSSEKPSRKERHTMKKKCGARCFLGPNESFPICKRNTCQVSRRGVMTAYKRARQWKHTSVAKRAKRMLK